MYELIDPFDSDKTYPTLVAGSDLDVLTEHARALLHSMSTGHYLTVFELHDNGNGGGGGRPVRDIYWNGRIADIP